MDDLPLELTKQERDIISWRVTVLVKEGFDTWHAGRLASIGDLDWRQAVALHNAGCTQPLVYELLR